MEAVENIKCECGHTNPFGTVLCESCGKPLDEKDGQETQSLDMRYEGAARRSQTRNRALFDKIWSFFSSVKVAVVLILLTLAVSILGTILPQEQYIPSARPDVYYPQQYGVVGEIYYKLGLSDSVFLLALPPADRPDRSLPGGLQPGPGGPPVSGFEESTGDEGSCLSHASADPCPAGDERSGKEPP